jgi:hypothetical protein
VSARQNRYEAVYETLAVQERLSFIKIINLSSQLHLNMIYGSVAKVRAARVRRRHERG